MSISPCPCIPLGSCISILYCVARVDVGRYRSERFLKGWSRFWRLRRRWGRDAVKVKSMRLTGSHDNIMWLKIAWAIILHTHSCYMSYMRSRVWQVAGTTTRLPRLQNIFDAMWYGSSSRGHSRLKQLSLGYGNIDDWTRLILHRNWVWDGGKFGVVLHYLINPSYRRIGYWPDHSKYWSRELVFVAWVTWFVVVSS